MDPSPPTDVDRSAARASARDAWADSTRHYFIEACTAWRTQPERAVGQIRLVVEGLVHLVCVVCAPTFLPYERGELRRLPLDKALTIAKSHLPPERRELVDTLKNLGNIFHHNQGVVQRSAPNTARGALLQCSELLAWMHRDLLRSEPPPDYAQALGDLEGAAVVATPLPGVVAARAGTPLPPAAKSSTPKRARPARGFVVAAIALGALAVVAVLGFVVFPRGEKKPSASALLWSSASPEVAWVAAYNEAIASHDVDRILSIHALPTPRYFMSQNRSASQLRNDYEGWFRTYGKTRETGFRNCQISGTAADGSRAVRCDTYVEPPLDKGLSVIPTCLVFRSDGRLIARTEIRSFPACPPPPL